MKVVVTGASKGIGHAIVRRFAAAGSEVAFCARDEKGLEEAASAIRQEIPSARLYHSSCDVSQAESRKAFFGFVQQQMGTADILVNNAGIYVPGQVHNEDEGVLELMISTNLYSAYHFTRLFVPGMIAQRSGHIFNMCSTASVMAYVNGGSYCIAKHALYGMSKVLREEMKAYDIKVTSILPGATYTHSWQGTELPEERFMKADDVADAVFTTASLSPGAVIEEILMRPLKGDI